MARPIVTREKQAEAQDAASDAVVRAVLVSTRLSEETLIALARKEALPVDVAAGRTGMPRKD